MTSSLTSDIDVIQGLRNQVSELTVQNQLNESRIAALTQQLADEKAAGIEASDAQYSDTQHFQNQYQETFQQFVQASIRVQQLENQVFDLNNGLQQFQRTDVIPPSPQPSHNNPPVSDQIIIGDDNTADMDLINDTREISQIVKDQEKQLYLFFQNIQASWISRCISLTVENVIGRSVPPVLRLGRRLTNILQKDFNRLYKLHQQTIRLLSRPPPIHAIRPRRYPLRACRSRSNKSLCFLDVN
jgi:hypothetical protein